MIDIKKKVLYVDDIRNPKYNLLSYEVTLARTYKSAIESLLKFEYDIVDLDNDLGEEKEGYDIAKFIVENNIYIPYIYIHTMNPVARDNMKQLLEKNTNSKIAIINI